MGRKSKYDYDFVKKVIEEKGGKLLSKEYKTTKSKISILCSCGHKWNTSFGRIYFVGGWCPSCATKHVAKINNKYDKEFVKNYLSKRKFRLLSKYENVNRYIEIMCLICGREFKTRFSKILAGSRCKRCVRIKNTINDAKIIAQNRCGDCLSKVYTNTKTKLIWQCSRGHKWNANFNDVRRGSWCPKCNEPKMQRKLENIIKQIFSEDIYTNYKGFAWLVNRTGYRMEIDIWVPKLKLAIEYDGEQHFNPVGFMGKNAEEELNKIKDRDKIKNKIIKENKTLVEYFIRFNYKENITREYVTRKLIKYGVINDKDTYAYKKQIIQK